jgi:hypothetical protein
MFEDSFSEGAVYYGRMIAIITAVIVIAFFIAILR